MEELLMRQQVLQRLPSAPEGTVLTATLVTQSKRLDFMIATSMWESPGMAMIFPFRFGVQLTIVTFFGDAVKVAESSFEPNGRGEENAR